jgi:hypothetical protein
MRTCGQCPEQIFTTPFPEFRRPQGGDVEILKGDVPTILEPVISKQENGFIVHRTGSRLLRDDARFSVVHQRQYLCATICLGDVVIWSLVNGTVISVIEIERVSCAVFDEVMSALYLGAGARILQFGLGGEQIREFEFQSGEVTALGIFGMGFTFDHRLVVAGMADGTVNVVACTFQDQRLMVVQQVKVSDFPIVVIETRPGLSVVKAFDSTMLPQRVA